MRKHFGPALEWFGSTLGALHVILGLYGFYSFGPAAEWVADNWAKLTRWLWDGFTSFLSWPAMNVGQRDLMTALLILIVPAIFAMVGPKNRGADKEKTGPSGVIRALSLMATFLCMYLFLMVVVRPLVLGSDITNRKQVFPENVEIAVRFVSQSLSVLVVFFALAFIFVVVKNAIASVQDRGIRSVIDHPDSFLKRSYDKQVNVVIISSFAIFVLSIFLGTLGNPLSRYIVSGVQAGATTLACLVFMAIIAVKKPMYFVKMGVVLVFIIALSQVSEWSSQITAAVEQQNP